MKQLIYILLFFHFINISKGQSWKEMENDYYGFLDKNQNELAIHKAKEMFNWTINNEGDTSLRLAISLKLIGNAIIFNKDSGLYYYEKSLTVLKNQGREKHIQAAKIYYNKSNVYYAAENDSLALLESEKSANILETIKTPEYPFNNWVYIRIAKLKYQNRNYRTAIEYCNKSLKLLDSLGIKNNYNIELLEKLGDIYFDKEDYLTSQSHYQKALDIKLLNNDSINLAASYYKLGLCFASLNDSKKYIEFLLKSRYLAEHFNNLNYNYINSLRLISEYYFQELQIENSIIYAKLFKEQLLKKYGITDEEYKYSLSYLGMLYDQLGDYNQAELYFKEFLNITGNDNDSIIYNYPNIKINLGLHNMYLGKYSEAETYFLEALKLNQTKFNKVGILNNIATLYLSMGLYDKASIYYEQNIDLLDTNHTTFNLYYSLTLQNLGNSNIGMGEYDNALNYLKQTKHYLEKFKKDLTSEYSNNLSSIGSLYLNVCLPDSAEKYFSLALENFKIRNDTLSNYYTYCLYSIGLLNNMKLNTDLAKKYYDEALKIMIKSYSVNHPTYMLVEGQRAWLNFYSEEKNLAVKKYTELLNRKINYIKESFTWLTEKEIEEYWKKEINFFNQIILIASKDSILNEANLLAYKGNIFSKAILLENNLSFQKSLSNSNDKNIQTTYSYYSILKSEQVKKTSQFGLSFSESNKLESRIDSLQKVLLKFTKDKNNSFKNKTIEIGDISNELNINEVALEFTRYFNYFDTTYYYSVLILDKINQYPQLIKLCKEEELKQFSPESELKEIYDLVWKPLLPYLDGIKTVYYSPSGLLNNIPFQALYKEENGQREYVMDKFTLHQLTSTRYLALDLKKKEQEPIENSIALFGGINYNDYPNAVIDTSTIDESSEAAFLYRNALTLNRDLDSTRAGASYLPGTKTEVNSIAQLLKNNNWSVDLAEGKNASENKIKSYSGNNSKSILHIATHGFAYPDKEEKKQDITIRMMQGNERYKVADNPMIRSGLLFGGANLSWKGKGDSLLNKTNEDGVLTAYELSQLDLSNTKLAVLSACETGKGAIQGSEGTFGLKRALKLAGVDNMIVSLWKVPDDATMEMMTLFYNELAKTKIPVSSFETAQKAMRFKYPTEPKKWAGFVFVR